MDRIAVVGSGISGLAAAYYLSRKYQVFLFESENRLGGHTHTVTVDSSRGPIPIDTGFIVHNDRTYPNLIRLLAELGVPRVASDMSFAVSCRKTGYEYSSRGVSGFLAQRRNAFRLKPYLLFGEIRRFNRLALSLLEPQPPLQGLRVGAFLDEHRFTDLFRELYLYPMASAIWSCPHSSVREFPAVMLARFFHNHGMLTVNGHPQWKTIPGGCGSYLAPITAPLRDRVFTGVRIRSIARDDAGVNLEFHDRPAQRFEQVVIATNGDRALPLLQNPSEAERDVLRHFTTSRNDVALHTDENLLPRRPMAQASWNYLLHQDPRNGDGPATLTYDMNRLQSLAVPERYCITLNANAAIRPEKIVRKFIYHHPVFTGESVQAQSRWREISGAQRTHYCGAYWFNGFHEDGVNSALRVAEVLGVRP
ncbi:MAG TPA: FAD-dependent oxidoreductase [Dongiaceae bacterium]|nr:FAD-dependent oxidoreductase [Dongiaceae bacterium]